MAKRISTWEGRLTRTALAALPVQRTEHAPTYGETASYTLSRCSEDGEHEWELKVEICGTYEPAQNGGHADPSWDESSVGEPAAFYFREGKGWSQVETTSDEDDAICDFLFERVEQDDGGYDGPDYDGGDNDYYSDRAQNDWESSRGY